MEKYTMFMDRKNQYSENEYTTQSNLQIHVYFLLSLFPIGMRDLIFAHEEINSERQFIAWKFRR